MRRIYLKSTLRGIRFKIMTKKTTAKTINERQRLLVKVEEAMLEGLIYPYQIRDRIKEIADSRTAENYINAVKVRWAELSENPEAIKNQVVRELSLERAEMKAEKRQEKDKKHVLDLRKEIRQNLEAFAKFSGVDIQRIILDKGESFDQDLPEEEYYLKTVKLLPKASLIKLRDIITQEYENRFSKQKALPSDIEEGKFKEL